MATSTRGKGTLPFAKLLKASWLEWGFPKIRGTSFGGPCNDSSILGSALGSHFFGGATKSSGAASDTWPQDAMRRIRWTPHPVIVI